MGVPTGAAAPSSVTVPYTRLGTWAETGTERREGSRTAAPARMPAAITELRNINNSQAKSEVDSRKSDVQEGAARLLTSDLRLPTIDFDYVAYEQYGRGSRV